MKEIYSIIDRFCKVTLSQEIDYSYKVYMQLFKGGEVTYKFKNYEDAHNFFELLLEGIYET